MLTPLSDQAFVLPGGPAVTLTAEAVAAIDGTVTAWDEWQTRLVPTGAASSNVHLTRTATTATTVGSAATAATAGPAAVRTAIIAVGAATAIGSTAPGGTACATATATVATPCTVTAATTATRTGTLLTARRATLRFMCELSLCVELLLACGEHERRPATDARQGLVLETHA